MLQQGLTWKKKFVTHLQALEEDKKILTSVTTEEYVELLAAKLRSDFFISSKELNDPLKVRALESYSEYINKNQEYDNGISHYGIWNKFFTNWDLVNDPEFEIFLGSFENNFGQNCELTSTSLMKAIRILDFNYEKLVIKRNRGQISLTNQKDAQIKSHCAFLDTYIKNIWRVLKNNNFFDNY